MSGSDVQPSGGTFHRRIFHNNLHYREVLATLRYGIEARKGLILFSGEAGTGKSALLERLLENLDPSVVCILETDPNVNFTDLLNLILRRLKADHQELDAGSLVDSCKAALRAYRDRGQIVCLILDNAQQLDELTLEYLMETFFPAEAEISDRNILQMILAGRPPIREKLLHPWLRPLNPHLGLVCHVEPLSEKDIGPFVADQLRACDFPPDAVDREALRQIYSYTNGNPRIVNELVVRAAQLAEEWSSRTITAEIVSNAARDVGLGDVWRSRKTNNVSAAFTDQPPPREETFDFETSEAATTDMLMQTFLRDTPSGGRGWLGAGRLGKGTRVISALILILVVAAWFQRDLLTAQVKNWTEQLSGLMSSPDLSSASKPAAEIPSPLPEIPSAPTMPPPSPAPRVKPRVAEKPPGHANREIDEPPATALKPDNFSEEANRPESEAPASRPQPRADGEERDSRPEPAARRNRQLEAEVERAIRIRAINGVDVSVIDGTAVLSGRVASERQKQAAERAAGSVKGVERVRNRIVVG